MRSPEPILTNSELPLIQLQGLIDRCLGNLTLVDKLIHRFKGSLHDSCERLQQAANIGDLGELAQAAHRLRGEASNLNATRIFGLATDLEAAAREGDLRTSQVCLEELVYTCELFEAEVHPFSSIPKLDERSCRPTYKGF